MTRFSFTEKFLLKKMGEPDKPLSSVISGVHQRSGHGRPEGFLETYQKLEEILTFDQDVCRQKCHAIEGRSGCFWTSARKSHGYYR